MLNTLRSLFRRPAAAPSLVLILFPRECPEEAPMCHATLTLEKSNAL